MHLLSGFADISVAQLLLVAIVALLAGIIGGVSGYGSGALMPLVLVPMVGAAPVVPIIGLLLCIYLMTKLEAATWWRFGIWMLIGLVVYAAYGRRHSRLRDAGDPVL